MDNICYRFGVTALDTFHNHLSAGHYRPDIKRIRSLVHKAQKKRLLFEEQKRSYELAKELLKSRESLLSNAYKQGFSQPANRTVSKFHWRKPKPVMGKCFFHVQNMVKYFPAVYIPPTLQPFGRELYNNFWETILTRK